VAIDEIDARTRDVTISRLGRPVQVRLLLPDGFDPSQTRWPVLYLLHVR